jgi:hypothetical protein
MVDVQSIDGPCFLLIGALKDIDLAVPPGRYICRAGSHQWVPTQVARWPESTADVSRKDGALDGHAA